MVALQWTFRIATKALKFKNSYWNGHRRDSHRQIWRLISKGITTMPLKCFTTKHWRLSKQSKEYQIEALSSMLSTSLSFSSHRQGCSTHTWHLWKERMITMTRPRSKRTWAKQKSCQLTTTLVSQPTRRPLVSIQVRRTQATITTHSRLKSWSHLITWIKTKRKAQLLQLTIDCLASCQLQISRLIWIHQAL